MTVLLGLEAAEHSGGDDAALRLAAGLAGAEGSPVVVTTVVPLDPPDGTISRLDHEYRQWRAALTATRHAEALTALRAAGVEDVRTAVVPASSVPAGLVEAAHRYQARVLVLGAATEAPEGRFAAGSVAEPLLHSSPVPLALAPRAWSAPAEPTRLTCTWADAARSTDALAATRVLAGRWGVPVRLATFVPERAALLPSETGVPLEQVVSEEWASRVQGSLDDVVADWPGPGPTPETVQGRGAGWAGAVAAVTWAPGDVLVIGSSRLGPAGRVFLGSTATKILRAATVPVLVVPRGDGGSPSTS
ncbi:universal stress protein [Modestobacter sp. VKM Ac-2985]|uniref:universal stress protein n=1 Tax=Modestobacter sp. VKM Ac-2985 TaxID=3004139 RepID=UPI0022ABC2FA|nr:universal stress protein [Modestobacter sp. VKM Ac-2985]MCZ2836072.1 universal stress protein [Modestobacter sp. VKM Ac-2985]